jgi:hypothetical protein
MRRRRRRAYARLRRTATHVSWTVVAAAVFAWAGAFASASATSVRATLLMALAFVPVSFALLKRGAHEAAAAGLWFIDPMVARYECFARASRAYSAWLARRVPGWWLRLDEAGWLRAIGELASQDGWRARRVPWRLRGDVSFVFDRSGERRLIRCRGAAARLTVAVIRDFIDACAREPVLDDRVVITRHDVDDVTTAYAAHHQVQLLGLEGILARQRLVGPPVLAQRIAWRWVPHPSAIEAPLALRGAFRAARKRLTVRRKTYSMALTRPVPEA